MEPKTISESETLENPCIAGILTLCTSSQGLLTTASKATDGSYSYNFGTAPFLAEVLKFLISAWLFRRQSRLTPDAAQITRTWESAMLFPVPSIIYWIHNNVQVPSWCDKI